MTTAKQVEANRKNATRSTGPRTAEGKQRSSFNALSHGMTAKAPTLPTEDPAEFEEFRRCLTVDLAPSGALEERLVDEIASLTWRLRRAGNIEHGVLAGGVASRDRLFLRERQRRLEVTHGDVLSAQAGKPLDEVIELVDEEMHDLLAVYIDDADDVQRSGEVRLASAFVDDAAGPGALAKLGRYEASLFRRRNQALEALQKVQRQRNGLSSAGE